MCCARKDIMAITIRHISLKADLEREKKKEHEDLFLCIIFIYYT